MLRNLSLTARTALVLGTMAAIFGGMAIYARLLLGEVDASYSRLVAESAEGQQASANGTRAILRAQREIYRALLQADRPEAANARLTAARQATDLVDAAVREAVAKLRLGAKGDAVGAVRGDLGRLIEETAAAVAAGRGAEARAAIAPKLDALTIRSRDATDALTANSRAHAEQENDRLARETAMLGLLLLGAVAVALLSGLALAYVLLQRGAARPLVQLAEVGRALAAGDLDRTVPASDRRDEVGRIAAALVTLREAALRARVLEAEALASRAAAEGERQRARHGLAARVEQQLGAVVQALSGSAAALQGGIGELTAAAGQISEQAGSVAAGATEATSNVQTVASAAEQLSASVSEITRQVAQSAQVTRRAVENAREADSTVGSLSEAAQKIGDVVRLIGDIAGQTNLLALNATIEAARAGEAGKGFAVVASEVKALASQTARATQEIGGQIAAIQAATGRAVDSIKGIAEVVGEVDHIAAAIAAAVEEQGAATREIARNVAEAAHGTNEVSANIAHVSLGVEATTGALRGLRETTASVARQGESLRGELDGLLQDLRAA